MGRVHKRSFLMIYFKSDYTLGACPEVFRAMADINMVHTPGYGEDRFCDEAIGTIKEKIGRRDAAVHLLVGGTQVNLTAISAFLRPHEAAVAAYTGHINVHETGAVEATGHKVIAVPSADGLVCPAEIEKVISSHTDEHMVKPRLVYISQSTELGTVYTKDQLIGLREVCDRYNLYLYMDGARLGCGLTAGDCDLTLEDIAELTDAFYIGGTKNGAMFGEALVILNDDLKSDFRYHIKQKGGMLAKGRFLGVQFVALFKNNLYFRLAENANRTAQRLAAGLKAAGIPFFVESPTNQIFPVLDNNMIKELSKEFAFEVWEPVDDKTTAVRFVTSWATSDEEVDALSEAVNSLVK